MSLIMHSSAGLKNTGLLIDDYTLKNVYVSKIVYLKMRVSVPLRAAVLFQSCVLLYTIIMHDLKLAIPVSQRLGVRENSATNEITRALW